MVVVALMSALCGLGIAFYVRFLVALCKEYRTCGMWYLLRLQPLIKEIEIIDTRPAENTLPRAA